MLRANLFFISCVIALVISIHLLSAASINYHVPRNEYENYNKFHANAPDINPNRGDLNSIESDFVERLRETTFNNSLDQLKQLYLTNRVNGHLEFDFTGFYEKRLVNQSDPINKIAVYQTFAYIVNNSPLQQELATNSFSKTVEKTQEFTISKTFGFSVRVGVSISFPFGLGGVDVSFEDSFSATNTVSEQFKVTETVTSPSQKVTVNPFSRAKVQYTVYRSDNTLNYFLDFEAAPNSKDLFTFFVKKMGRGQYGQKDLQLHCVNDKIVLRNFPESEQLPSLNVEVTIFEEEPLSSIEQKKIDVYDVFLLFP